MHMYLYLTYLFVYMYNFPILTFMYLYLTYFFVCTYNFLILTLHAYVSVPNFFFVLYVQFSYLIRPIITTIIFIVIHLPCFSPSCFIFLLLDNISCMVKQHQMYKPIEIWWGHLLENKFKST